MASSFERAARGSLARDRDRADTAATADLVLRVLRPRATSRDPHLAASALLERIGGLDGLARASAEELARIPGLGHAGADRLIAAVELGRRLAGRAARRGTPFRAPADVDRYLRPRVRDLEVEQFRVFGLDARHRLRAEHVVSVGTLTASLVHPREVFRFAVREGAAAILIAHNHPSGDPAPSAEDAAVTDRLAATGRLVGIRLIDHVIVAAEGYYSFREAGRLEEGGAAPG